MDLVPTLRKIKRKFWVLEFGEFGCDQSVGLRQDLEGVLLVKCASCMQNLKARFKVHLELWRAKVEGVQIDWQFRR